jgi:hypothetical protein
MFCNLSTPLSLSSSFLFPEIRWQKEEAKNSAKKKGGEEKGPTGPLQPT